jgi:hypothetical protein
MKPQNEPSSPAFIRPRALAVRWASSLAGIYRQVENGTLPAMRIGNAIKIPLTAVENYERNALGAEAFLAGEKPTPPPDRPRRPDKRGRDPLPPPTDRTRARRSPGGARK